jgi:hypothetical protein
VNSRAIKVEMTVAYSLRGGEQSSTGRKRKGFRGVQTKKRSPQPVEDSTFCCTWVLYSGGSGAVSHLANPREQKDGLEFYGTVLLYEPALPHPTIL